MVRVIPNFYMQFSGVQNGSGEKQGGERDGRKGETPRKSYPVPKDSRYDDQSVHIITEFSQQPQNDIYRDYMITAKS